MEFATLWNPRFTAALFLALALVCWPIHAQDVESSGPNSPNVFGNAAEVQINTPGPGQVESQSDTKPQAAPNSSPVIGDALTAYAVAVAKAQAARANALQAQAEALRASQVLQQAIAQANQSQAVLAALVSARAKKSGAAEGTALA